MYSYKSVLSKNMEKSETNDNQTSSLFMHSINRINILLCIAFFWRESHEYVV